MNNKQGFILKMGELSSLFGFSHVLGQIYGYLYLSPQDVGLDEIKDALGVSKATVSLNVRELLKWGAVKRIWKAGTRKDFYQAETDFIRIFNTRLADALLRRIRVFEEGAESLQSSEAAPGPKEERIFIEGRINEVRKAAGVVKKILQNTKDLESSQMIKWLKKIYF